MGAALKRLSVILLAALALVGCRRGNPSKVEPWVWPGANRFNTFFFAQTGTQPRPALRYAEVWNAEWFDLPQMAPVPALAHASHRPLVVDLDHDGRPEIVTSPFSSPPGVMLNADGVPYAGRDQDGVDWSLIESDTARIVLGDSAGWTLLPESSRSRPQPSSNALALLLNRQLVTLQVVLDSNVPFSDRTIECRNGEDGVLRWRYAFGARPDLMAVADLDGDGSDELLVTTHGEENGGSANGTRDSDSCYCVALRGDGTRLWQRGFGAHSFIGCLAGVADLDRDGKQEVFVPVYSWQNDFGGLAVLDGATGEVIAASPGPDSVPVSHVSAGCADVDADGRPELAVAVSGTRAEVLLYRLEEGRLTLAARRMLSKVSDSGEVSDSRLHAICDLNGDGKCELVVSRAHKRMICRDPMFYPTEYDSCALQILDSGLDSRQEIPLAVQCQDVTLGDVVPGGNIELLVVTDRLRLYSTEAE